MVPLGLGGLSSVLAASLGKYRGIFIFLTLVLLGLSHYLVARQPKASTASKVILWGSTVVALAILAYTLING